MKDKSHQQASIWRTGAGRYKKLYTVLYLLRSVFQSYHAVHKVSRPSPSQDCLDPEPNFVFFRSHTFFPSCIKFRFHETWTHCCIQALFIDP